MEQSEQKSSADHTARRPKVLGCTCQHAYQDLRYGKGLRLHNATNGKNRGDWRCTVCGKDKNG